MNHKFSERRLAVINLLVFDYQQVAILADNPLIKTSATYFLTLKKMIYLKYHFRLKYYEINI